MEAVRTSSVMGAGGVGIVGVSMAVPRVGREVGGSGCSGDY